MDTLATLRVRADKAVRSQDVATLRELIENGATFANFTIRAHTSSAESWYAQWLADGRPTDLSGITRSLLSDRQRRMNGVRSLTDEDIWTIANLAPRESERYFADRVRGFGPAKASFALACAGIGQQACFDTWLLRKYAEKVEASGYSYKAGNTNTAWPRYWTLCDLVYRTADSAAVQWAEWLQEFGRGTVHSVLV